MPWNLVEGLVYEHGEWMVGESPSGLYDVTYACQRCHQLGSTNKATKGEIVPNPAATIAPTATTAVQWARDASKSVADFMSDPTVSQPGMSIQCESCHGTGAPRPPATTAPADKHWNSGTQLSNRMPDTTWRQLATSQVCGQCHGSYTAVTGTDGKTTLGVYGYTPNLPFRTFGDINGLSGGASYTYIPTEAEFMAAPTKFFMFPNGSNAKGNHYYYNEWSASAHSYRGAYYTATPPTTNPDAMTYQAAGNGHYNATAQSSIDSKCYRCHTGEGYLESKGVIDKYLAYNETFTATKDNTGFLGQECSTCHGGHPASLDEADVVRAPDKAGRAQRNRPHRGQPEHLRGLPQLAVRGAGHEPGLQADRHAHRRVAVRAIRSARRSAARSCWTSPSPATSCPASSARTATCPRPTRAPTATRTA